MIRINAGSTRHRAQPNLNDNAASISSRTRLAALLIAIFLPFSFILRHFPHAHREAHAQIIAGANHALRKRTETARWQTHLVIATAYVIRAQHGCTTFTSRTASDTRATQGTIAVDPKRFAFGTRFRIPGYGYGVARDTGSLITGSRIDLAMLTCSQAYAWGRRILPVAVALPQ